MPCTSPRCLLIRQSNHQQHQAEVEAEGIRKEEQYIICRGNSEKQIETQVEPSIQTSNQSTMPSRIIRSYGNRQRRVPAWTSVALALILAATSTPGSTRTVDALVLPKLRVRTSPNSMAVWSTADKKQALRDSQEEEGGKKKIVLEKTQDHNGKDTAKCEDPKTAAENPLSLIIEKDAQVEDTFEIHVGRALDTLKKDYPSMLTDSPDFSIFDKELEVIDPTGVKLHGLKAYKNAFRLIHGILQVFYCPERSGLTFRMCYDTARQSIRVSWNAEVVPKAIFGGVRTTLHVDGISVYEISRKTGMITQHRIERLVMNDTPIRPQQGIFALLRNEHDESVPVFNSLPAISEEDQHPGFGNTVLEFRRQQQSRLFSKESLSALSAVSAGDNEDEDNYPGLDWDALERKNASRKKFGVPPLTPEEFMENEAAVKQMESQQRQKAASASAAAEMAKRGQTRRPGFMDKLFGDILPETCESNYDCVRPELCCDFGFKKICCSSGTMVGNKKMERQLIRVPADMRQRGEGPQQGPPTNY